MFQHQNIWLPNGEKHFPEWMDKNGEIVDGKGTYQIKKWRACIPHIKNWRVAVDVGAHVGFWSLQLVKKFELVEAFEPVSTFRNCWIKNVAGKDGDSLGSFHFGMAVLHSYALGATAGRVSMKIPELAGGLDTGGTHVSGDGDIEMRTLDSFAFQDVDFLKIDVEGFEHQVIAGARETLLRCKPCVIVEQKQHKLGPNFGIKGTPAVDMLRDMGARIVRELGGDFILVW